MRESPSKEGYLKSAWWSGVVQRILHTIPSPEAFIFSNNFVENGQHVNPPLCSCGHKDCPNPGKRDTEQTRLFAQKQMIDRARQEMHDEFRQREIIKLNFEQNFINAVLQYI
jgi:hypothetical protein